MIFEICNVNEILPNKLVRKKFYNETDILLIKENDKIRIIAANCPHAGAPLEDGYLLEGLIICSWHRSTFKLKDGKCIHGPSEVSLTCFEPIIINDKIYLDICPPAIK